MFADDFKLITLYAYEFIAMNTVQDLFGRCFNAPVYERKDLFILDLVFRRIDQVFHNPGSRFPERILEHGIQTDL